MKLHKSMFDLHSERLADTYAAKRITARLFAANHPDRETMNAPLRASERTSWAILARAVWC